jgi:tellurite resistance protein
LILLAVQANSLRTVPYAISAWAYSFPLAAAATALLAAGHAGSREGYTWLGVATLMVASLTVAVLLVWSVVAVRRGEICRPGH